MYVLRTRFSIDPRTLPKQQWRQQMLSRSTFRCRFSCKTLATITCTSHAQANKPFFNCALHCQIYEKRLINLIPWGPQKSTPSSIALIFVMNIFAKAIWKNQDNSKTLRGHMRWRHVTWCVDAYMCNCRQKASTQHVSGAVDSTRPERQFHMWLEMGCTFYAILPCL